MYLTEKQHLLLHLDPVLHIDNIDTKRSSDRGLDMGVSWCRKAVMPTSGADGNVDPGSQKCPLCAGG